MRSRIDMRADDVEPRSREHRLEIGRGNAVVEVGTHGCEPIDLGPVEPVAEPRPADAEVVGQDARGVGDLGNGEESTRNESGAKSPERIGLVSDVMQRHRCPDDVGGVETVETVRQFGEMRGDPPLEVVRGGSPRRAVEHRG